jgi:DNA-binding transcriptional regulator LsrR (DeoR family)
MSENYDKIKAEKTREHRQALAEPDKHIITETDLRTARIEVYREMGLKQREIGEKLGIARQTVSHYLNQGAKNK